MSDKIRGGVELAHNSTKHSQVSVLIGDTPMTFESGKVAKQAAGSVWVRWGDSVVLVAVCVANEARAGADFLPLTCEYIEKSYAAGRIPGGFFKREAKPRDSEILNARIIDRSLRPLFPEGFYKDVQVVSTVVSHDGEHDTDVMALCGASMALHLSQIPFAVETGPIAGVRVGRIDGKLVANPTVEARQKSDIDMIVAVSKQAIVMVEGGAEEVLEADLIQALFFAHEEGQKVIEACEKIRQEIGKEKEAPPVVSFDEALKGKVETLANEAGLTAALKTREKLARYKKIDEAKERVLSTFLEDLGEETFKTKKDEIGRYIGEIKSDLMRTDVLKSKTRLDGRKYDEIRQICNEIDVLPRVHGSALFTRGETQALVSVTLGTSDDAQRLDTLIGESSRRFMLHYNFPPFSVGEARPLRGTSRREIGHGALAERAVEQMVPSEKDFPYTLRIVSEITESNGSSSMASVCGATLSLWDAGVNIKSPVAGIAMGMIKEGDDFAILSDILGDEDHLGDMDFKVCGSEKGVTAIQMDIKIDGLSKEIMTEALEQAKRGRLHILEEMKKTIESPREDLSEFAPRIKSIKINPDKIRDVIGPGGRIIRDITARTGAKVEITDDGIVNISAVGSKSVDSATKIIEDLTREAKVNCVYKGMVRRLMDFGAFIELFPGTEGLCHISELSENRVNQVSDVLSEGDEVNVVVMSIDRDGKIRLSRKRAKGKEPGEMV